MKSVVMSSLLVCVSLALSGCNAADNSGSLVEVKDVQVSDPIRRNPDTFMTLDVRTPAEYAAGHIEGAINIDINNPDFENQVALLSKDETYLVHCALNVENGRSEKALNIMKDLGFTRLENLVGGYEAWKVNDGS